MYGLRKAHPVSVIMQVVETVVKFVRHAKTDRNVAIGIANAIVTTRYLVARKLGYNYKAVVRLGHNGRYHPWPLERREDLTVLKEVFLDDDYQMPLIKPSVIFDLGANFGAASVYFALCWPHARIFAVEAHPIMYARLQKTVVDYTQITPLSYAVGAEDGTLPFTLSSSSVGSSLYKAEKGAEVIEVEVRALRSLMKDCAISRIDLLKFDIEGAEDLLLEDASVLEAVDAFVGEIHPDLMEMPVADFLARFADFETTRQELHGGRFLLRGVRRT